MHARRLCTLPGRGTVPFWGRKVAHRRPEWGEKGPRWGHTGSPEWSLRLVRSVCHASASGGGGGATWPSGGRFGPKLGPTGPVSRRFGPLSAPLPPGRAERAAASVGRRRNAWQCAGVFDGHLLWQPADLCADWRRCTFFWGLDSWNGCGRARVGAVLWRLVRRCRLGLMA